MIEQPGIALGSGSRTTWAPILKRGLAGDRAPNLTDYDGERSQLSWDIAQAWLQGLPGGRGLNIAHEAVDRHAAGPLGNRVAMRWVSRTDARRDYTYADLRLATNRFANVLRRLGIGKGDVVATLRNIAFVPTIPLTRSGKIMRRLLKARERGLPEGDTSTLEPS